MKILVVTPFDEAEWRWFGEDFGKTDYEWSFLNLDLFGKKLHRWFISSIKVSREISKFDLVSHIHLICRFI